MAQSLNNKFSGCENEVRNYVKTFGIGAAMRQYGVKDYLAFTKYLHELGVDAAGTSIAPGDDVISKVVGEFTKTLLSLRDEVARLRSENSELRKIADARKVQKRLHDESVALDFLSFCNSPISDIDDPLAVPVEA